MIVVSEDLKRFIIRRAQYIDEILDYVLSGYYYNTITICEFGQDEIFGVIADEITAKTDDSEKAEKMGFWDFPSWEIQSAIGWYLKETKEEMILDWFDETC